MNALHLYFQYISITLRCELEHRASFLLTLFGRFLVTATGFVAIDFLFSGFTSVAGYRYADIMLCYAIVQLSFSTADLLSRGFGAFSSSVRSGAFDRMLVRPRSTLLQVLGSRFNASQLGPVLSALFILLAVLRLRPLPITFLWLLTLFLMLAGGVLLFTGLFMLGAVLCFFTIEETGFLNMLTYGAKEHGKYPIDVYGPRLFRLCTFVIPYTLIQYYPLQVLLGRSSSLLYALSPLGAAVFFALCCALWHWGVRRYVSCGS